MLPADVAPNCATDPRFVAIVDAAFARASSTAATFLATRVCPTCPIRDACLAEGDGEAGVWGGLSRNSRTRLGYAPRRTTVETH